MMTGSANNGGYPEVSLLVSRSLGALLRMRMGWVDLRKTALGASSPAKPALHIPEL